MFNVIFVVTGIRKNASFLVNFKESQLSQPVPFIITNQFNNNM